MAGGGAALWAHRSTWRVGVKINSETTGGEEFVKAALGAFDKAALDVGLERLRAAIARGEVGEAIPWTPELNKQLSREADEMYWRGEKPDPDVCP